MLLLLLAASPALAQEAAAMPAKLLPGTQPLTQQGDLAAAMVADLRTFLLARIAASADSRRTFWKQDFASPQAYAKSVAGMRVRLARCLGVVDPRVQPPGMIYQATFARPALVARTKTYSVYAVRWPVLDGVDGEGLLLEPATTPKAQVVALGDADQSPEMLVGLAEGLPPAAQYARRLARAGCRVLVPVLIDRKTTWSGNPAIRRKTPQPHREWIYRQAFEVGRHIIGYEVQKVLAGVDWFATGPGKADGKAIGVMGYGEGALVALQAAALDERIAAALVSGYFQQRDRMWSEPIYRNVWRYLSEFGDAGSAWLVAPRTLIVEASEGPKAGPCGTTPGTIESPAIESTRREFARAAEVYRKLSLSDRAVLVGDGTGAPGRPEALRALLGGLGVKAELPPAGAPPKDMRGAFDPTPRLKRQFDQLQAHAQAVMRRSESDRARTFWRKLDTSNAAAYERITKAQRHRLSTELIGELPPADVPPAPRSRLIYQRKNWTGYQVVLDVWKGVWAYGILLVPNDIQPGERRPVVVCQHGLEGRPRDTIGPASNPYSAFSAQLADRGFVVFAPQNPYIGRDDFRVLQRMAQPMGTTLFSIITRQHERIVQWLGGLPCVDPTRIALYGISYGGKTAMRVGALVGAYAAVICSADFNEWVWKNCRVDWPGSYMFTGEYDMAEFDLAHTFSYAEMAALIAPRPFMVERGHHDGVAPDEWVAYEYAKVRRLYAALKIPGRTEIEFFDGPHRIHGVGTFAFLHKHLKHPAPRP